MPPDSRKQIKKPKRKIPLILVSNDDGISSPGILLLAAALKPLGKVVIVAPDREQSAASHALTLHKPLRIYEQEKNTFSVSGTPTDCVNLAVNAILKELPDLVVSGVNRGANLGDDLHYSGTVAAAVEGVIFGIPAIAVSQLYGEKMDFSYASEFAAKVARKVLQEGLPPGHFLNINVPNLPKSKIKGYDITTQGKRNYGDVIVEKLDPRGKKYYWIGGNQEEFIDIVGSDCNAVLNSRISITPVRTELTAHEYLDHMRSWEIK